MLRRLPVRAQHERVLRRFSRGKSPFLPPKTLFFLANRTAGSHAPVLLPRQIFLRHNPVQVQHSDANRPARRRRDFPHDRHLLRRAPAHDFQAAEQVQQRAVRAGAGAREQCEGKCQGRECEGEWDCEGWEYGEGRECGGEGECEGEQYGEGEGFGALRRRERVLARWRKIKEGRDAKVGREKLKRMPRTLSSAPILCSAMWREQPEPGIRARGMLTGDLDLVRAGRALWELD